MTDYPVFPLISPVKRPIGSSSGSVSEGDLIAAFPGYYVDPTLGSDSLNDGLSLASPWATLAKLYSSVLPANSKVYLKAGQTFTDAALRTNIAGLVFDRYGVGNNPRVSACKDVKPLVWTDNLDKTYTAASYTNAAQLTPTRASFDGGLGVSRGGSGGLPNLAVSARGAGTGDWTDIGAGRWTSTFTFGSGTGTNANRLPAVLSFDSGAIKYMSEAQMDVNAAGKWFCTMSSNTTCTVTVYSPGVNPFTAFASITASALWFASRSGTAVTVSVFSPTGTPDSVFTEILVSGQRNDASHGCLEINHNNTTVRNIDFLGADDVLVTSNSVTDALLENCKFKYGNTSGGQLSTSNARWYAVNCHWDENGLYGTQGNYGFKLGSSVGSLVEDFFAFACSWNDNGEDGLATQGLPGSRATLDSCEALRNGENGLDCKTATEMRLRNCTFRTAAISKGAGVGPATIQSWCTIVAEDCTFTSSCGTRDGSIGGGGVGVKLGSRVRGSFTRCSFFAGSNDAAQVSDSDLTYSIEGETTWTSCLFVVTRPSTQRCVSLISGGRHKFYNCTFSARSVSNNMACIGIAPSAGTHSIALEVYNCILHTDGASTASYLIDRAVPSSSTFVTVIANNNIYFHSATSSTQQMRVDTAGSSTLTEALIDGGVGGTLDFDGGTTVFNVGSTLTGASSGATAVVVATTTSGASPNRAGTLVLRTIVNGTNGAFRDNEVIADNGGTPGAAVANGILSTGFQLSNTPTDPTQNPHFVNRYKGGAAGLGDYSIGGNVWKVAYDGQTANFTQGELVTTTSGGTGYVRDDFDSGATGVLVISSKTGTWADNDTLTGNYSGVAVQNGAISNPLVLRSLAYDTQTVNYTNGLVVSDSSGTALLISQLDLTASTGILLVAWDSTTSDFTPTATLTDTSTGSAKTTAVLAKSPARRAMPITEPRVNFDITKTRFEFARTDFGTSDGVVVGNAAKTYTRGGSDGKSLAAGGDTFTLADYTLPFDGQSANFTVGQVVTGPIGSGTLVAQVDSGATGTLYLRLVTGTFADNQAITDPLGGAALVNSTTGGTAQSSICRSGAGSFVTDGWGNGDTARVYYLGTVVDNSTVAVATGGSTAAILTFTGSLTGTAVADADAILIGNSYLVDGWEDGFWFQEVNLDATIEAAGRKIIATGGAKPDILTITTAPGADVAVADTNASLLYAGPATAGCYKAA